MNCTICSRLLLNFMNGILQKCILLKQSSLPFLPSICDFPHWGFCWPSLTPASLAHFSMNMKACLTGLNFQQENISYPVSAILCSRIVFHWQFYCIFVQNAKYSRLLWSFPIWPKTTLSLFQVYSESFYPVSNSLDSSPGSDSACSRHQHGEEEEKKVDTGFHPYLKSYLQFIHVVLAEGKSIFMQWSVTGYISFIQTSKSSFSLIITEERNQGWFINTYSH